MVERRTKGIRSVEAGNLCGSASSAFTHSTLFDLGEDEQIQQDPAEWCTRAQVDVRRRAMDL